MKYGYFDDSAREYVITRPDTPNPWANYLGSPEYGAIITQNAGGYSFVKSGAAGRIIRYRFNESDRPGRYIYLKDDETGEYWSQTWQPCGKPLDEFKTTCRHGTGYTKVDTAYKGIESAASYYVPLDQAHEVWALTVTNASDVSRTISIFGYAEFTNEGNYEQDNVNLQYTQFITRTYFNDDTIFQTINENCHGKVDDHSTAKRFFTLCGNPVDSYCGDRENFIGNYQDYGNPASVENGKCDDSLNYGGNSCGALHTKIKLNPGESRRLIFLLGQKNKDEVASLRTLYSDLSLPDEELSKLCSYWHANLENLKVTSPDPNFNSMINTWNAYQCFITFIWSRAASLMYCGLRNGYGYRDTVQDIGGIIHLSPEMAKEKLIFMLSAQMNHGGALPLVKFNHKAGSETGPEDEGYVRETGHPSYRADDALWLFPAVFKYVSESGDIDFLDLNIPYANEGSATVYGHLQRAIDFSMNNQGLYGLPAGLHADWNDCLKLGKKGVSSFVAFQLYYAFDILSRFAKHKKDDESYDKMMTSKNNLAELIEEHFWDEDRFVRGISEKGEVIGSRESKEASFWLNPQSWSVISGFADEKRSHQVMDSVHEKLNTPYGVRLMAPPFKEQYIEGAYAILFNPGMKENSSIFLQTQGWLILAEALLGRGSLAYKYYKESCPAAQNDIADIRKVEPYVYSQFTEGSDSPNMGRSRVHWLTGTAATVMVSCVEGILGLRPDLLGIKISPSIPPEWKELKIEKCWRGKLLRIKIENPDGKESGFDDLTLNGKAIEGNYILEDILEKENDIIVK
ncbi:MAG: N,N'-diacetylchitobiose phosphorylase [Oscillospiraceae bacterium]|nr:N,N'-diacetylchitobiose phosphorylase [Oscillospiraceae bacterium]